MTPYPKVPHLPVQRQALPVFSQFGWAWNEYAGGKFDRFAAHHDLKAAVAAWIRREMQLNHTCRAIVSPELLARTILKHSRRRAVRYQESFRRAIPSVAADIMDLYLQKKFRRTVSTSIAHYLGFSA